MTRHRTYSQRPMNPRPGISPANLSSAGYWYAFPVGAGGSALILNSEFCILNWTFTFSAKEKDSETGLSYFGSRYYSSDLSIWLSVDPMAAKYASLSPYVYCANNPVKLVDPNGEYLEVANNDDTHHDLLSIVDESHRNRVIFNKDGSVSVNLEGLSEEALNKDIGLSLINDMVNSDYRYYYETSDIALCRKVDGERFDVDLTIMSTLGCFNESVRGLNSNNSHDYLPIEGFDGQVVISKTGIFRYGHLDRRKNVIFHELEENFLKTDRGMNFWGNMFGRRGGAHQTANDIEFIGWSTMEPGSADYYNELNGNSVSDFNIKRAIEYINTGQYK